MPRAACSPDEPAELEFRHTGQDAEWDFRPWLSEKLNRLQTAVKGLFATWLTDPYSVFRHDESPVCQTR